MGKRDDDDPEALVDRLRSKQQKHGLRVARVEDAAAKLARESRKLQTLEADIAELERRLAAPRLLTLGRDDPADGTLRPVVLIFNPCSGLKHDNAVRLAQCVASLRAHGIDADVHLKTS